jgi:hypothetical protein
MPTPGSDVDVKLTKSDASTEQGLILLRRDNVVSYTAKRLPDLPEEEVWVEQKSWHLGFGDYLARPDDPYRYAFTDSVDTRHANGAQLGQQVLQGDYLIRNMDAEVNSTAMWAVTGTSAISRTTTASKIRKGSAAFEVTSGTTANSQVNQTLDNPTAYRPGAGSGNGVLFYVYVKSSVSTVQAFFEENGTVVTTDAHTGGGAYELLFAGTGFPTGTVGGSATALKVGVRDTSTDNNTYQVDGGWMYVGNQFTGGSTLANSGINPPLPSLSPTSMVEYAGKTYAAIGITVVVWDSSDNVFDLVETMQDGDNFTGSVVHGGHIYVATDSDNSGLSYYYSDDGSAWTSAAPSVGDDSDLFIQVLDAGDVIRLLRVDKPNSIHMSNETYGSPVEANRWQAAVTVGESDKNITGLYTAFGTSWVGREDGLYFFSIADDAFKSATDQFKFHQSPQNFDHGMEFVDGAFYTTTDPYGLVRFVLSDASEGQRTQIRFEQVAPRHQAAMYDDYGGRIRALVHDGTWMYAVQDSPPADTSSSKKSTIMAARNEQTPRGTELVWHTLAQVDMGTPGGAFIENDELWVFGRFSEDGAHYRPAFYRMALPTRTENMMKEATAKLQTSGTLVTAIFDFGEAGAGTDMKGFTRVVVYGENVNSDRKITVEEQRDTSIDDSGSWTAVGSAITSLTSGAATVAFASATTGRRLRLRFTLESNVTTDGPILRGFRIYAVPSPDRYWVWEFTASLVSNQTLLSGVQSGETAENILANLKTLDEETYPLKFHDLDGTSYDAEILSMEKTALHSTEGPEGAVLSEHLEEAVTLRLREVLTS